jgi:hypothetical protein
MSGLTDKLTLDLLAQVPTIFEKSGIKASAMPVVLMDPDSDVVGGSDDGHESIVNATNPLVTQMWARPAWTGMRAHEITGEVSWEADGWQLRAPLVRPHTVPGYRARHRVANGQVEYWIELEDGSRLALGTFRSYPPFQPQAIDAESYWSSVAALLLDVMRRTTHSDLAVLPKHFIDEDIVDWLATETAAGAAAATPTALDWLSRYVLAKATYKMENIVTVSVEGSKLAATLDDIVRGQAAGDEQIFAAGRGANSAWLRVDRNQLRVNERPIVADRFYRIAMPQSLAEVHGLRITQPQAIASLIDAVDAMILGSAGIGNLTFPEFAQRLEARFARQPFVSLNVNPARGNWFQARPTNAATFGSIPLAGRTVRAERQWGVSGRADAGVDWPGYALRAVGELKYSENVIAGGPASFPDDEWTMGVRGDRKFDIARTQQRAFLGLFYQSQFQERVDKPVTLKTGQTITPASVPGREKPAYLFGRAGIDIGVAPLGTRISLKNVAAAFDVGWQRNERQGFTMGAAGPFDISEAFDGGLDAFLAGEFARNPSLGVNETLIHTDADRDPLRSRVQLDGGLEIKPFRKGTSEMTVSTTAQFRFYVPQSRPDFSPRTSLDARLQVDWTVVNRLKIGPFVQYYGVDVKGSDRQYDYVKFGIDFGLPFFAAFRPSRVLQ